MATANQNYVDMMTESLQKKIEVLSAIIELNKTQQNILNAADFDIDKFDENVHNKAEQIDKLEQLDNGFTALFNRVKAEIDANRELYSAQIKTIQNLIRRITELSVTIEAEEKRNKALVDKRFSILKKEVKESRMSANTASKYYKSMNRLDSTPQFLDSKH